MEEECERISCTKSHHNEFKLLKVNSIKSIYISVEFNLFFVLFLPLLFVVRGVSGCVWIEGKKFSEVHWNYSQNEKKVYEIFLGILSVSNKWASIRNTQSEKEKQHQQHHFNGLVRIFFLWFNVWGRMLLDWSVFDFNGWKIRAMSKDIEIESLSVSDDIELIFCLAKDIVFS